MKSALLLLSGTTLAALTFVTVVLAGSNVMGYGRTHQFEHLGNPLWTVEPTYISRGDLSLDQVMASVPAASSEPEQEAAAAAPVDDAVATAHVDWCMTQYRSYRVSDNTYQPFEGPRRACTPDYGI